MLALLLAALAFSVPSASPALDCPEQPSPIDAATVLTDLGLDPEAQRTMLWRFEGAGGGGFVFGTVHLGPPLIARPPPQALLAIRRARIYAGEIVMDRAAQRAFLDRAIVAAQEPAAITRERLGAELHARYLDAARRRGIAPEQATSLRLWSAFLSIGRPPTPPGASLDEQLEHAARRMQLEVVGLQEVHELIDALEAIPESDQLTILIDTICQQATLGRYYRELLAVYSSGAPEAVVAFSKAGRHDDAVLERLDELLVERRNALFAERLTRLLARGPVFLAVGAQHLPGPQGLLARLRRAGFSIEPMP